MTNNITWFGPCFSFSGYAQHNRGILIELHKLGWNIKLLPSESYVPEGLQHVQTLLSLTRTNTFKQTDNICINLVPPPSLPQWGKYTILYTTIESATVHEGYLNRCLQYDEIWFPCKQNIQTFKKYNTKKIPVHYVQEGVDIQLWRPDTKPDPRFTSKKFTFMYVGDWSYRKGNDIIIRAYSKAFLPSENVQLVLFTHYQGNGPEITYPTVNAEIHDIQKRYSITRLPEIKVIGEHYTDAELPAIFKTANCGIFPTRGEAWLLPAIQLMSIGIPVITTAWGGQMDYCNKDNSYLIQVEKFDTIDDKVNCTVDFYKGQKFAFPSVEHTAKLMRDAFSKIDQTRLKGAKAFLHVSKNFDWSKAGQIAHERLLCLNKRISN